MGASTRREETLFLSARRRTSCAGGRSIQVLHMYVYIQQGWQPSLAQTKPENLPLRSCQTTVAIPRLIATAATASASSPHHQGPCDAEIPFFPLHQTKSCEPLC